MSGGISSEKLVQRSDALRELGLVVGRVGFGCDGETFNGVILKTPEGGSPDKSPEEKNRYFTMLVTIKIREIPVILFPGTYPGSLLFRGLFRGHYLSGDFIRGHVFSGEFIRGHTLPW